VNRSISIWSQHPNSPPHPPRCHHPQHRNKPALPRVCGQSQLQHRQMVLHFRSRWKPRIPSFVAVLHFERRAPSTRTSRSSEDRNASDADKLASLKFLGHWVGDVHQPLHVSFADDRGGNEIEITGHLRRGNQDAAGIRASLSRVSATICLGSPTSSGARSPKQIAPPGRRRAP
jgi:hypothetical protein